MFRLLKLIFMILLINDKIFCDEPITDSSIFNQTGFDGTDVGTFLTEIFTEEVNEKCPGQCVHKIVSLMCPHVIETIACKSSFQKCCATKCCQFIDNSLTDQATIVETSPPLEETTTTLTLTNSEDNQRSKNNENKPSNNDDQSTSLSTSLSTTLEPLTSFTSNIVKKFTIKCTGECIDSRSYKNCANILTNSGLCDDQQICCLQSNNQNFITTASILSSSTSDSTEKNLKDSTTSVAQTTLAPSTTSVKIQSTVATTNQSPTINESQSSLSEKKIVVEEDTSKNIETLPSDSENSTSVLVKQSHNKNSDESTQVANNLPKCNNCVMMLFTLLCDAIDNTKSCPSGNKCCVYFDEENTPNKTESIQPSATTSTQSCQGKCLPSIIASALCPHPINEANKKVCGNGWGVCCESPDSQANSTINYQNEKPPMDYSDGTFVEPSELTLNNLNNYNKLSTNKPPNYYQLVPRPPNLLVPPNQPPTNLLGLPSNWPFLNGNNQQKIPVYKPLLSNSQMIPSPYLQNKNSLLNTGHPLNNNMRGGQSSYTQMLNNLNTLNNLNNRSPPIYYQPSSNPPASDDLFNTLSMHLSNSHLSSNTILPTIPTPLKLNSTSNLINHLLLTNKIPQATCIGTCLPQIARFYCYRMNHVPYTNFACSIPQQICCASTADIEAYETFVLANLANNETSPINSLQHHTSYLNNLNHLPAIGNSNQKPNLHTINKPVNSVNVNLMKTKNYNNLNKMRPIVPDSNPNVEKLTDINQPSIPAASNSNRHRHPAPNSINKNANMNKSLPQITLNNKWSNSLSNLSSNHFSPNEKPLNLKPVVDKFKKPTSYPSDTFSVEVQSSLNKLPVCGLAGDENDPKSRWCWQVAIVSEENQFVSSGALIGTNWVLTTASAVSELVKNAKPLFVRVGDLTDLNSENAQIQKVATTYIHHNHNGETFENDIALLKLSSAIQLKSNICLICLPARGSVVQPGRRCSVAGYSLDSESLRTKEASVPIINDYQCSKKINSLTNKNFILPTSSFCTNTNNEDVNDSCSFDEGSPLGCYYEDDGYYELTGLVSYNFGCGNERVPTIYVRVSLFIAWINQIISVNN